MRIPRLFLDLPLNLNSECELPSSRAHYLVNVLRLQAGRKLVVFNGQGGEYEATLVSAGKKTVVIKTDIFVNTDNESPLNSELAIAVSKGDRMDWIVQKATELGVKTISPLITERAELKLNKERWEKKISHWQEIIISACEQSGRNRLPQLNVQTSLPEYLEFCSAECKLVLHPGNSATKVNDLTKPSKVSILIGPEGGFSDEEICLANQQGFQNLVLGPRILRTETAPVAALGVLQNLWGDLN